MGKKQVEKADIMTTTTNEVIGVKDIQNQFLYTKDGYILTYLRISAVNIELLSQTEKESKMQTQTAEFISEKNPFSILVIPRSIDMEVYLDSLSTAYDEAFSNIKRKMLINEMIKEANNKILNGQNFEHQFYLKIWDKYDPTKQVEHSLLERLRLFDNRYQIIGIGTKRLNDSEIIRLCNLFSNGVGTIHENYEDGNYIPIPRIKR